MSKDVACTKTSLVLSIAVVPNEHRPWSACREGNDVQLLPTPVCEYVRQLALHSLSYHEQKALILGV